MKPLFLDIDTQNDFMLPAGALYAGGAERVILAVGALNRFAVERGFPLVSTACLHLENDAEFREWAPHCVVGTVGQLKPAATLVGHGQILFTKQHTDVFRSASFLPLLQEHAATEYVVYGVVTEVCVHLAAEGLLATGKQVTIVSDAVCALSEEAGEKFLQQFVRAGGVVATSSEICVRFQNLLVGFHLEHEHSNERCGDSEGRN